MDFSEAINKLNLIVMYKFSTFVLNKVVRCHEWGEVENVYIAYNFSDFVIYQPNIINIDGNLTKFWQKQFFTVFSETWCIWVRGKSYPSPFHHPTVSVNGRISLLCVIKQADAIL